MTSQTEQQCAPEVWNTLEHLAYLCYFFFEMAEESGGGGHSAVINLVNPVRGKIPLRDLRGLIQDDLVLQRKCSMTETAQEAIGIFQSRNAWPKGVAYDANVLARICARYEHPYRAIGDVDVIRRRRFMRLVRLLWLMHAHGVGAHSRAMEFFFPSSEVLIGRSPNAPKTGYHTEHVVPCAYIRDLAFRHFVQRPLVVDFKEDRGGAEDLSRLLGRIFAVAYISQEERALLDDSNNLPYNSKSGMPDRWRPADGDILIRLRDIGINELVSVEQ